MPRLTAIDLGFIYSKSKVNHKPIIMKSVVGNSKILNFSDLDMGSREGKDHIVSRYAGEDFFVSDLAIEQSDSVIHSLKAKRFDSTATQVLVNAILGIGFGSGHNRSYVVSGLPVSHYASFKSEITKLFLGEAGTKDHDYSVLSNNIRLEGGTRILDGRFIPQPFGVLIDATCDGTGAIVNKQFASKTVAVVDIGFGTTDVYVCSGLSPVERLTFSTQTAMNHAYRLISSKIEESFNVTLPLYAIEKIVKTSEFSKNGRTFNMATVIQWAFQSTAEQLVSEVLNKWKTLYEIDHILLAGGGALALGDFILPEFENSMLADNSQWAVVNGYWKWGMRTWKDVT